MFCLIFSSILFIIILFYEQFVNWTCKISYELDKLKFFDEIKFFNNSGIHKIYIGHYVIIVLLWILSVISERCFLKKKNIKILKRVVTAGFSEMILLLSVFLSLMNPYWNPYRDSMQEKLDNNYISKPYNELLSLEEARDDLDYAMKYLKKVHPVFLDKSSEISKKIETRYNEVKKELENKDKIDVTFLNREIESIFSLISDAHTLVKGYYNNIHKWIGVYRGCEIKKVNGRDLIEILRENKDFYSYELESWGVEILDPYLRTLEGLSYVDISLKDGIEYTYIDEDGNEKIKTFYEKDFLTNEEYKFLNKNEEEREQNEENKPFVYYEIDKNCNLALLTLNECIYDDEYINCLKSMFTEIKSQNIGNVAVDLRNNRGGESKVISEFFRYLDIDSYKTYTAWQRVGRIRIMFDFIMGEKKLNNKIDKLLFKGNLYLLTSNSTFSSAMDFASYIQDNKLGKIIGEIPGNCASHYGDKVDFKLPNSNLIASISYKYFNRPDKNNKSLLVKPDIKCGKKEAIDKLYELLKN